MERRTIIIAAVAGVILALGITGIALVLRQRATGGTEQPPSTNTAVNAPTGGGGTQPPGTGVQGPNVEIEGDGKIYPYKPPTVDPNDPDGDGLSNAEEAKLGTDPQKADTDGDGLTDGYEVNNTKTDPTKADTNGNGINDNDELIQARKAGTK